MASRAVSRPDLRLGLRNGSGVAELLTGPLLNGEVPPDHELAAVVSVLEQSPRRQGPLSPSGRRRFVVRTCGAGYASIDTETAVRSMCLVAVRTVTLHSDHVARSGLLTAAMARRMPSADG